MIEDHILVEMTISPKTKVQITHDHVNGFTLRKYDLYDSDFVVIETEPTYKGALLRLSIYLIGVVASGIYD